MRALRGGIRFANQLTVKVTTTCLLVWYNAFFFRMSAEPGPRPTHRHGWRRRRVAPRPVPLRLLRWSSHRRRWRDAPRRAGLPGTRRERSERGRRGIARVVVCLRRCVLSPGDAPRFGIVGPAARPAEWLGCGRAGTVGRSSAEPVPTPRGFAFRPYRRHGQAGR